MGYLPSNMPSLLKKSDKMTRFKFNFAVIMIFTLVGILLSLLLFNTDKISNNTSIITPKVINDYKNEIENQELKTKELSQQISELQEKLDTYTSNSTDFNAVENELYNELEKYDIIMGRVRLTGPGVEITMSDSTEEITNAAIASLYYIHNQDVLEIVNELRASGAEAIAINGYQVSWNSSIDCAGPVIQIDNYIAGTPFIISAIGDQEQMMAMLESIDSYTNNLRARTININISMNNNIIFNKK